LIRAAKPDRRVERTRQSLLDAFRDLVLTRGYDAVTVRDIAEAADVGRSTFYEHFDDKDALFETSLRPLLGILADTVCTERVAAALPMVVTHFGHNRRLARVMMGGSPRRLMARFLSHLIEERLTAVSRETRATRPLVPLRLIAAHLADAQLGLLEAWLLGKPACAPEAIAHALHVSTRASAAALLARKPA
jgi:AcrR family transcriptional regulator